MDNEIQEKKGKKMNVYTYIEENDDEVQEKKGKKKRKMNACEYIIAKMTRFKRKRKRKRKKEKRKKKKREKKKEKRKKKKKKRPARRHWRQRG